MAATNSTVLNEPQLATHGEIGVQVDARIEVRARPKNVTAIENISWVSNVRPAMRPEPTDVPGASDGNSLGVEQLHQSDITGDGVKVGVIDAGFDASNPSIQDNIVDTQSYTTSQRDAHGTSVAEVVTRTAPDSDLYLVSAATELQNEQAIEYLIHEDVDIIVASWGYPYVADDGTHFLTDEVNQAQQNGVLFVVSAGNDAQKHWQGDFQSTDGDIFHEWAGGDERNCLPDCSSEFAGGQVTVYIRWEDQGQPSEYLAALYNPVKEEYITDRNIVAETRTNKYAVLSANVQPQAVDLVVGNTAGSADDEIEVLVNPGPREMQYAVPESSISAPGDVPSAFTVAAYERGQTRVAPYSSRGPTNDGRQGIDVTGYTNINVENGLYGQTPFVFRGTSAAAPYVGGIAALAEQQQPGDTSPTELATTLRSSSDDILSPGADTISGSGVVNAIHSVNVDFNAERDIGDQTVQPGESTNVTVTIQAGTTIDDLGFADGFNSSLSASVVDDDGATISAVSSDEVVSSWGGVSGATITYEVTVPENASTGTTYDFAGTVENRDTSTQTTIDGNSTIEVGQPDPVDQYRNDQGVVDPQGLLDAAADFRAGEIDPGTLLDIAAAFRNDNT